MTTSVLKAIFIGALFGAVIFFMPKFLLLFFLLFFLVKMCFWGMGGRNYTHRWALADKIRSMSEEDYNKFKNEYSSHCYSCGNKKTEEK